MRVVNSLENRFIALLLSIVMILSMVPVQIIALGGPVAQIGETTFDTLEEALAAVPTGTNCTAPDEVTTITLLRDTTDSFDVGVSNGSTTMNLVLNLNGKTLTVAPGVGSVGTKSGGIRVLAYSKMEIKNGTVVCSSDPADNIKVGIANYSELTLTDVAVNKGDLTIYTVNNRGKLTLNGKTKIQSGSAFAITNDPYDLYYTTNVNASVTCNSSEVEVESMQIERYARTSNNKGGVELNISEGYFGKIVEDGETAVDTYYNITGGIIGVSNTNELALAMQMAKAGAPYTCPEKPVIIRMQNDMAGSFDVGLSNGTAPKNILLDLNTHTLTLKPGVGSENTKSGGIRVLAYSKMEIKNGTVVCSSETADNIKVGIANYSELTLTDVAVNKGALTIYTVNNRGKLTLNGKTKIQSGSAFAITNDPYNLYYTTNVNASVTCNSSEVEVESMQIERYARTSNNKGGVELNISAGYFGKVVEDGETAVDTYYNVTGGIIGVSDTAELAFAVQLTKAGAPYTCPENPVTIQLKKDMAGSFDMGLSNGTTPKNILLDLNTYTLTLKPGVGSENTKSGGIRVLAYSKLEIKNGTVVCSSETADNIKVGIANYSKLILDSVDVQSGELTIYTINNRGDLTLKGNTTVENGKAQQKDYPGSEVYIAITNDPYNLYYKTPINATVNCTDTNVTVGNMQLETYGSKGDIVLNITAGTFGGIYEPASNGSVSVKGAISGGSYDTDVSDYCAENYKAEKTENDRYVVKSKQTGFGFAQDVYTVAFGANGNLFATNAGTAQGTVTYSVVSQKDTADKDVEVIELNTATGEVKILKAGTVQIKAVASGNDQFAQAEDTYTLVIEPSFAQVDSFSGGTVTGNETENTVVYIDKATLEWTAKNESIGRVQDGWWVGAKVVAPEGIDLSKAVYQRKGSNGFDGAAVIPFVPDADRYMGLWGLINAEYLTSFSNAGKTLNYVWRFSWDGDDIYEQTVTITIDPSGIILKQSGFAFEVEEDSTIYGEGYAVRVPQGGQAGTVTYTIKNISASDTPIAQIDPATGILTINKAGTVEITATKSGKFFQSISDSYILNIKKADQSDFAFEKAPTKLVWQAEALDALALINGKGEGAVTWTIIEGLEYATVDSATGKITLLKAGGKFTLQAQKAGDDCYNASAAIKTEIEVLFRDQENFGFAAENATITYNHIDAETGKKNQYSALATGGQSTKDVFYQITNGNAAIVDEKTGVVTVLKAGTVEITATKPADEQYNEAKAVFTLTIQKDVQDYTLPQTGKIPLVYGTLTFANEVVAGEEVSTQNKPVYAISANEIGATVDANGLVSFTDSTGKVGKITVTVTVAEDDCYKLFAASYELDVAYLATDAVPVTDGEKMNDSDWYTDKVVIKAPKDYQIAYSNNLTTEWNDKVSFATEGINNTVVYLKNAEGYITDGIAVKNIKLDTGSPTSVTVTYNTPTWEKVLETITFGIYNAENLLVKISAKDTTSGIASLTYNFEGQDIALPFNGEGSVSHSFTVNAQYRNRITVVATDASGRQTKADSGRVLVLDTKEPKREVVYEFSSDQYNEDNDIYYTQGDVKAIFTITEENFDLSLKSAQGENVAPAPVLTVNKVVQSVTWTQIQNTDQWTTEITLSDNGDYVVALSYTDRATNKMVDYVKGIHIDAVKPVISASYNNNEARNSNYYKADRIATIQITEHNFKPEGVNLTVTAKDITGADVDISAKDYTGYAKTPANWTQVDDVWTLKLDGMLFNIDAIYAVTLEYTDLAENAADTYTADFVIDKTVAAPEEIIVKYSQSIVDKILGAVTFGFYKGNVQVTVTVKDQTAGIEYFEITYNAENGANNSNKATYTTDPLTAVQDANDKTVFTATHTIPIQARGTVSVNLIDKAGNETGKEEGYVVVADTIAPGLIYAWTFTENQVRDYNGIFYTQADAKVKFTVTEANFDLSLQAAQDETAAPAPVLTVNGVAQNVTWTQLENTDQWEAEYTLSGNGDYVVELTYTDRSTNAMDTYMQEIRVDNVAPVFEVTYDNNEANNINNYKADRTATVKVTEHNFKPEEVNLTVTAKDITGADVDISAKDYTGYAKNIDNWTQADDVWTLKLDGMLFDIDAIYHVELVYTDLAENDAEQYTADFVVDKTAPENVRIEYSSNIKFWEKVLNNITFGYYSYQDTVTVTLIAEDITSGVDYFTWSYKQEENTSSKNMADCTEVITNSKNGKTATATFDIDAQARGYITVDVTDKAGNTSGKEDSTRINVVDNVTPTRTVSYTPERILDAATLLDVADFAEGDNVILYYKDSAVVTFAVTEANFYAEDVVIKVNGAEMTPEKWIQNGDVWTGTITISGDGDYVVTMAYTDRSSNEMVSYTSQKIAIDSKLPEITVKYTDGAPTQDIGGRNYYKTTQTLNITVTEHNFRADDFVLTVTAKDVQGNDIDIDAKKYAEYAKNRDNWVPNGDVHTLEIEGMVFDIDAIYTVDMAYADLIGNAATDYPQDNLVVDHENPTGLQIAYSESIVGKIMETITFGFYKSEVTVTLTAEDITSGVDYFDWYYTQEIGTSSSNTDSNGKRITADQIAYTNNGLTATATFKIPANARGYISATVADRAGNTYKQVDDKLINVVDAMAPSVSVEYVADAPNTKVQFVDAQQVTVDTFQTAAQAYYSGNVTAKIVINEANFFEGVEVKDTQTLATEIVHNVGIKLTKTDDDGNVTVYEYLPVGAAQKYVGATPVYITWNSTGDVHTINISYAENADYVLEIEYTDLSTNDASISANDGNTATQTYKSKVVTVDKLAPVVDVVYSNEKVIHTIDGRDYLDAKQTATITVKEHNFRAEDFAATVVAKDILGNDVNVEDFKATLSDDTKWDKEKKKDNIYTIIIEYAVDANYTFDFTYEDLAQNPAEEYAEDIFTVDTTAPENLTVTYSTSVLDKVLESITFGYYNAEMTVTITAEDDVAGIYYFVYSYIKGKDVSDVNAELFNDKIADANNRIVFDGKTAITSFTIPKLVLSNDNQFNGTVEFTAYDRSENNIKKEDNRRVVVDNIAPTATITYNQPVQKVNDISYYAGNIDAKIVVNEANFYSEDVIVRVNDKNVAVKWVDDSVDTHTGTFTINQDGDYVVTVEYKDRSQNEMTKYTSNRLTRDTKIPTVNVSNIKNNSANKDEKYGFVITADDINLDASSFKPTLTATVRKDDGSYETKTVSLGDMKTVAAGKTYTFTVDNLEEDAVYTLVCTIKDMSGNTYSKVALADGKEYEKVQFSINRNGSTFTVDQNTDTLVNQYYVYSVNNDVVIYEINVDPVETYTVKLNGKLLVENTDYTSSLSDKTGEWSKRTYIISKSLFEAEGEYSIVVESVDKAETTAYSDVKNLNVSFVVDQTAPALTISGLETSGRYQVEQQTVTVIPTDDGGRLNSIKVLVLNSDGEPLKDANGKDISVRFEMAGEDFLTYLEENNGTVTFTVPEGLENQVQIICNDCAVNAEGKTNAFDETYTKVTVSQSQWIIFYANKPLFYGSIAGVVLVIGGIFTLIFLKKRKKSAKQ